MNDADIWQSGPLSGGLSSNPVIELYEALGLYIPFIRASRSYRLDVSPYLLPDISIGIALQEADADMHCHREIDLILPFAIFLRFNLNAICDP